MKTLSKPLQLTIFSSIPLDEFRFSFNTLLHTTRVNSIAMSLNPSLTGNVAICVPARLWQVIFPHRALCHNYRSSHSWLYWAALRQPLVKTPYNLCLHGKRGNPSDPLTSALILHAQGLYNFITLLCFDQKLTPSNIMIPNLYWEYFQRKAFHYLYSSTYYWLLTTQHECCVILSSLISEQSYFTAFFFISGQ